MPQSLSSQTGFGFLEVLIALVVISVGVMSMAGLQVNSSHTNFDALQRNLAVALAEDMLERMRLNPNVLANYAEENLGQASLSQPTVCEGVNTTCSENQMAAYDLWQWERELDGMAAQIDGRDVGGLLSPSACIRTNAEEVQVVVAWRGRTPVPQNDADDCGAGLGRYGANDDLRRLVVLNSRIHRID